MGRAGALTFAAEGARVACFDIDRATVEETAVMVNEAGGRAEAFVCNIAEEDDIRLAVAGAVAFLQRVDICWSNAGVAGEGRATELARAVWDRAIAINLTGAWLTAKHVLPHLIASGHGSLIFTASTTGMRGSPNVPAMAASKAGVMGLARQIAMDYAKENVRSNVICPGPTMTTTFQNSYADRAQLLDTPVQELMAQTLKQIPLNRFGAPQDIVNLALFLASDESSYMTGHWLPVDGGRFAKF